jgi:REP element-mobilizing transposase RayT
MRDCGNIVDGINTYNEIINQCWREIPEHYPGVVIDESVVMPDHFHGIVIIPDMDDVAAVGAGHARPLHTVVTGHALSLRLRQHHLPDIIGSFKSAVSKKIHESGNTAFRWQRSYYDRIIRNEDELNRIRIYIRNNPLDIDDLWTNEPDNEETAKDS